MLRLGLERITEVLQRLGNPHHSFQALHVAGTNGKGSTCALLEAALLACLAPAGLRVGKFVSPFLVEPRDGVWLDGAPLAPGAWAAALAEVTAAAAAQPAAAPALALTPFEQWTAAAFVAFARAGVHVAVVEVGVGGGGDATNALPPPLLALVTHIAMDHVDLLGPGLADIAGHKAGIFKAGGGGALSAPGQAPEVLAVLRARAEAAGLALAVAPALPWERRGVLRVAQEQEQQAPPLLLPLGLAGDFQAANASLAWAALQHLARGALPQLRDARAIAAAWARAQWRGRAELVQLRVTAPAPAPAPVLLQCTLDGGHNAHAMAALAEELAWRCSQVRGQPSPALALVFACGAARNAAENFGLLLAGLRQRLPALRLSVFTVRYALPEGMPWVAAHAPEALAAALQSVCDGSGSGSGGGGAPAVRVQAAGSVVEALQAIASDEELRGSGAWRAICGSLYLVSDVARLCEAVPLGEGEGAAGDGAS